MRQPGGDDAQTIRVGDYIQLKQIGEGSFGTIYEALNIKDNKSYAVKQQDKQRIDNDPDEQKNFKSEVGIMQEIKNFHIIKMYDFLESDKYYYLAMQQCSDGDLSKYMKKKGINHFTEKTSKFFIAQISLAFRRLHKDKIMHRDFKLDNIFIDQGNVVLGDLGFAKKGADTSDEQVGTPYYLAPEIFQKKTYTNLADLWSVGVTFFQLLFGRLPFNATDMPGLYKNIMKNSGDNLKFPLECNDISPECQNLIRSMLQADPDKRISWKEFFNHKLFDEENLNQKKQRIGDFFAKFFIAKTGYDTVFAEFSKAKEDASLNFEVSLELMKPKDLHRQAEPQQIKEVHFDKLSGGMASIFKNIFNDHAFCLAVDRYQHEKSKIQFIWETVSQMDIAMRTEVLGKNKDCKPQNFSFPAINLNCIMAKKAITMWYLNYNAQKNKRNIFRIENFDNFMKSKTFKEKMYDPDTIHAEYESYWKTQEDEIEMQSLYDDQKFEIEKLFNNLVLPVVDQMAESQYKILLGFFSTDEYKSQTPEWQHHFAKQMLFMHYSINCEDIFQWSDEWEHYEWIEIYTKTDDLPTKTIENFLLKRSDKPVLLVK